MQLLHGDVIRPDGLAEGLRGADWLLHLANHSSLHERDETIYTRVLLGPVDTGRDGRAGVAWRT